MKGFFSDRKKLGKTHWYYVCISKSGFSKGSACSAKDVAGGEFILE
jgi:hypothetical protein